ncbi:MAG: hypothetical protein IJ629_00495 [Clostridia bacterium]|nr:hypothetical protein [Clostridia bacterium]
MMIINTLENKKIKILVDEIDLKKAGISPENWISNSNQTLSHLENLLKSTTNSIKLSEELVLKDYIIFTYNYHIFSITLFF